MKIRPISDWILTKFDPLPKRSGIIRIFLQIQQIVIHLA